MATKREASPIYIRRTVHGIAAASQHDAELIAAAIPLGSETEISIKKRKRSLPQLRLYWKALHQIVKDEALPGFPTAEHLHESLKYSLGYFTRIPRMDGGTICIPDSAAFEAMDGAEFKTYFDNAMRLLAEQGVDPLQFYEERKAA